MVIKYVAHKVFHTIGCANTTVEFIIVGFVAYDVYDILKSCLFISVVTFLVVPETDDNVNIYEDEIQF